MMMEIWTPTKTMGEIMATKTTIKMANPSLVMKIRMEMSISISTTQEMSVTCLLTM
jgi:hypothetical protein